MTVTVCLSMGLFHTTLAFTVGGRESRFWGLCYITQQLMAGPRGRNCNRLRLFFPVLLTFRLQTSLVEKVLSIFMRNWCDDVNYRRNCSHFGRFLLQFQACFCGRRKLFFLVLFTFWLRTSLVEEFSQFLCQTGAMMM